MLIHTAEAASTFFGVMLCIVRVFQFVIEDTENCANKNDAMNLHALFMFYLVNV